MKQVTVLDYHLCNLYSVKRALEHVGAEVIMADQPEVIAKSEFLVIPGVGAFGQGIDHILQRGLLDAIMKCAKREVPILGICLGMQLLMTWSEELGRHQGLNLIEGSVNRLEDTWIDDTHYKIPHIGWNVIDWPDESPVWDDPILKNVNRGEYFYFVHSFGVYASAQEHPLAMTKYGHNRFCSLIRNNRIYGCQFHPEKSGEVGLRLLQNFLDL